MSDIFFDGLGIPTPAYRFEFGGLSHGQMTGRMIEALEEVFLKEKPDAVLIYGDTNSTLAGAIAATKIHIPIVHVEAGLRSFNRRMPEEINRILSDQISALLLCPTKIAVEHLAAEGITNGVHMVGDVMHDATLYAIEKTKGNTDLLDELGIKDKPYAVCTLHRAENTDDEARFESLMAFLEKQAEDREIIFPIHPRTRNVMQKKAYFHRKPCITMRDETEWVETVETGWNRLWTSDDWHGARGLISDYGLGDAAEKSAKIVEDFLDFSA